MITKQKSKKATTVIAGSPVITNPSAGQSLAAAPLSIATAKPEKTAPAPVKLSTTMISAKIDVGFGNKLFIRGEGPGLSWDKGLPMECAADDVWTITIPGVSSPIVFKVLVNDTAWSLGENYRADPGQSVTIAPGL